MHSNKYLLSRYGQLSTAAKEFQKSALIKDKILKFVKNAKQTLFRLLAFLPCLKKYYKLNGSNIITLIFSFFILTIVKRFRS